MGLVHTLSLATTSMTTIMLHFENGTDPDTIHPSDKYAVPIECLSIVDTAWLNNHRRFLL